MSAKRFLKERFDLQPTTEKALLESRPEYMAQCRRELANDMVIYLIGALSLALLGMVNEQQALLVLGGIFLAIVALSYLSVRSRNSALFNKAVEAVNVGNLPERLVLLQENNSALNVELIALLQNQDEQIFRYQIQMLYSLNHRDRISDLKTAL